MLNLPTLNQEIFEHCIKKLEIKPVIDLFASRLNYKMKLFIAYQPDPEAGAINAFTISWKPHLFYALLPFRIKEMVLQNILEEQSAGVMVVPKWTTQPWWPHLMRMLYSDTSGPAQIGADVIPAHQTLFLSWYILCIRN